MNCKHSGENLGLLSVARIIKWLGIVLFAALMLAGCILLAVATVGLVAEHGFWYVASAGVIVGLTALFCWANDFIKESKVSR